MPSDDLFTPDPISLLQYLRDQIDREDWRNLCSSHVSEDEQFVVQELDRLLIDEMTTLPYLSVDAYDAVWAMQHRFDYVPQNSQAEALVAFGVALAVQAEFRGIVVADSGDRIVRRLIELCDKVGVEALSRCGRYCAWLGEHVNDGAYLPAARLAGAVVVVLISRKKTEEALLEYSQAYSSGSELDADDVPEWKRLFG